MAAFERMWPLLTPAQLLRDLFGSRALLRSAAAGVLRDAEWESLHRPRGGSEDDYEWSDADVALLDEAYAVLGPRSRSRKRRSDTEMRTYGHIVVDECQDQPPMALRMIAQALAQRLDDAGRRHRPGHVCPRAAELAGNPRSPAVGSGSSAAG